MRFRINGLALASLFVVAAGCTQSTTSDTMSPEMLASYQSSLALATEPDQAAVSVLEVRELLGGGESVATDNDDAAPHADDGHHHDTDGPDHSGHDEGDAHTQHADAVGHEDDEHGDEQAKHDGHEHDGQVHAHDDHGHEDHADEDHAHEDHAHEDHAHEDHAHEDHAHEDHAHGEHDHPHAGEGHPVVIVGKIGGAAGADGTLSDFPWEKGRATFIISDPSFQPVHEHDHGHEHGDDHSHDDHECHFCQAEAIDAQAWVRFLGEDNKPLAVDARELFDVKEGDIVVVKGVAKLSAGLLVVDAQGMYVRR